MVTRREYLEGEKIRLEEILKRDLTLAQRYAFEREYKGVLLSLGLLKPEEVFAITPAKVPERVITPEPPKAYVYKVLPSPPPKLHDEGLRLYGMLDDALFIKDKSMVINILKRMLLVHQSPSIAAAIVLATPAIIKIIASVLGSFGFAEFLMEEAVQTSSFAVKTASDAGDWELEAKALAKEEELLDRTIWEQFIGVIPLVNVAAAVTKYFEAARVKHEIDKKLWKEKRPATSVNESLSLKNIVAAIESGSDPSQYLPTAEPSLLPEVFSGEVISVVDGDTVEVKGLSGEIYRVRLVGIDAPEFKTTAGKESGKFLTDLIHGKTVTVEVDPNNQRDKYGRVLGRILYKDVDINKKMLSEGQAGYYFIGENKYVDVDEYKAAAVEIGKVKVTSKPTYCKIFIDAKDTHKLTSETFELKEGSYIFGAVKEGYRAESQIVVVEKNVPKEIRFELTATALGEDEGIEEVTAELKEEVVEEKFTINITSSPANAKLYIDDVYTRHWTPSNERELSDVIGLLSPGEHTLKVTKAGKVAEKVVTILSGANPTIHLTLEDVGLPPPTLPPEVPEEVVPKVVVPDMLKALFEDMMELTIGRKVITRREVEDLKLIYAVE